MLDRHELMDVRLKDGPLQESLDLVRASMTPIGASRDDQVALLGGIIKILSVCRPYQMEQWERGAWLATTQDPLASYRLDSMLDAMARWRHKSKWLPAPAELIEDARSLDDWRRNLEIVLVRAVNDRRLSQLEARP